MTLQAVYAFPDDDDATLDRVLAQIGTFSCLLVIYPLGVDSDPDGQRRSMVAVEAFTALAARAFTLASAGLASRAR